MRGWYSIHDHENMRMGFIPHSTSTKKEAIKATSEPSGPYIVPPPAVEEDYAWGLSAVEFWLTIGFATVFVVTIILVFTFCNKVMTATRNT